MIELLSEQRCVECDLCVVVCPDNVFERNPDGPPAIARKADCQTCFLCELYCPVDALYVAPAFDREEPVDEDTLIANNLLGSYRREMGWRNSKPHGTHLDMTFRMFTDGVVAP